MTTGRRDHMKRAHARKQAAQRGRMDQAQAAVKRAIQTVEKAPVKVTSAEPVYTKQATPDQAAELYRGLAEICKITGIGEVVCNPAPVELPMWKPAANDGYPAKTDTLQLVTLADDVYNGYRIPFPKNTQFPVYMVANQDGKLMQTPRDGYKTPGEMILGWNYRTAEYMEAALQDVKRLKTWQRYTYGKHTEPADVVKLPARGTLENFEINTKSLLASIRQYSKKVYLEINGYLFPAKTIADICRVADGDTIQVEIKKEHVTPCITEKGESYTKTTPAIILRHGNAKTTLLGQIIDDYTKNLEIVPCTL
jgi:hypothetical protein